MRNLDFVRVTDRPLEALFRSGASFDVFLREATARKALWDANWSRAAVPEDLLARAMRTGGPWRFLVVAVDGCSDSVSTIPYLAKLVGMVPAPMIHSAVNASGHARPTRPRPDGAVSPLRHQ